MHPRLQARGPWLDHEGELPLIHGTLIRLKVDHLPGDRDPKPLTDGPFQRRKGVRSQRAVSALSAAASGA
ncbi:hypothetical protein GCM10022206_07150 [Streptomyces chiangmaiensis]